MLKKMSNRLSKIIKFKVWNKRHNRVATEDEFKKYVRLGFEGVGFVDSAYVLTRGDLEIRIYDDRKKNNYVRSSLC